MGSSLSFWPKVQPFVSDFVYQSLAMCLRTLAPRESLHHLRGNNAIGDTHRRTRYVWASVDY